MTLYVKILTFMASQADKVVPNITSPSQDGKLE